MQNSIQNLKNDVSNLTQLLKFQKYVNSQLLQNIKTIQDQVDKLAKLPDTVQNISTQATTLVKSVDGIKGQVDKLEKLQETIKNEVKTLTNTLKDQTQELKTKLENELKGKVDQTALDEAIKKQTEALKALTKTITDIKSALNNKVDQTTINQLQQVCEEIKKQITELNLQEQITMLNKTITENQQACLAEISSALNGLAEISKSLNGLDANDEQKWQTIINTLQQYSGKKDRGCVVM